MWRRLCGLAPCPKPLCAGAATLSAIAAHGQYRGVAHSEATPEAGGRPYCESLLHELKYKPPFGHKGARITPPKPGRGEVLSAKGPFGPVLAAYPGRALTLQAGPHGSVWLRAAGATLPDGDFAEAARDWLAAFCAGGSEAAFFVAIGETSPVAPEALKWLRANGFSFHHYHPADGGLGEGELVYFKWCGHGPSMVPPYATASESVGVILLSPDERSVLLVWEYGNWKLITGNVGAGESAISAARREALEEVSIMVDSSFNSAFVGGWHHPAYTDGSMNNAIFVFALRAPSTDMQADGTEIEVAKWFQLDDLPSVDVGEAGSFTWTSITFDSGDPERATISALTARYLSSYRSGSYLVCREGQDNRVIFEARSSSTPIPTTSTVEDVVGRSSA